MWVPVAVMTGLSASCYTLPLPLPLDELLVTVYDVCMMSPVDCSGQIQVTSRTSVYKQSIAQMHGAPHHAITSSMDSYTCILAMACRGYEIIHPYPYPYSQIFRGYPWIYPYPVHRCPSSTALHIGLCTWCPQIADGFYYSIFTIATSISIPYLVSK